MKALKKFFITILIVSIDLTFHLIVLVCLFTAVTEARSCTKGSVFLINYSLTIARFPSHLTLKWFSSSLPFVLGIVFSLVGGREMKTAIFADGERLRNYYLFILWFSPQISLHLFRLFSGGEAALSLVIFSGGFLAFRRADKDNKK